MEAKNLTDGERKYMDDTVGDHDRLNFYAWVDKKKDKKIEKRLMVVTDHRLLSIKRKVTGNKTVRRNGHLYDLVSLDCTSMDKVKVTFNEFVFEFEGNLVFQAVNAISNAVNVLYHDFPDAARPQINLCEEMEDKLKMLSKKPEKPRGGYLLEHYVARCSFLKTAPSLSLKQFLTRDSPHLQLSECPGIRLKGSKEVDLKPLFMALRYNTFVESILLEAVPKKDFIVLLADTMASNGTIHTVHLIKAELGDNGWTELGAAMKANPKARIVDLDFSKNRLSNKAALALSIGLKGQSLGAKSLKFGSCELKPKGLSAIIDSISSNKVHWTTLEEIDFSGNSWDDSVSRLLTSTLEKMRAVPLHTLRIQDCGVNVFSVMHAIEIVKKSLKLLDLSGNRINSSSLHALCSVLSSCQVLQELKIGGCKLNEAAVESILNAIGSNTTSTGTAFRLDVSRNELGAKKAKGTAAFVRGLKAATPLREICIKDNKFRLIDLFAVLKALKESPNLTRLSLGTVKASYNAKLMNVVVDTMKSHPIEYLDLSGDADCKNFYGKTLLPLFETVPVLKNLKELDIRYNKIGAAQFQRLCESLKKNSSLMVLKIDGNNLTQDAWSTLNDLLNVNSTLAAVDTPFSDIATLVAASKDKEGTNSLLLDLWKQIQDRLERRRNGQSFLHYRASLSRSEQLALKNMTRNTLFVALDSEEDAIEVEAAAASAESSPETSVRDEPSEPAAGEEEGDKEAAASSVEDENDGASDAVEEEVAEDESPTEEEAEEEAEATARAPAPSAPCGGMRVMPVMPVTARIPSRESMALNRSVSQKEVTRGAKRPMSRSNSDDDLKSRAKGQPKVTTAPRRKLQRPNLQPPGSLPTPGAERGRGRGAAPSPGGRGRGVAPGRGRGNAPGGRGAAPVRGQPQRGRGGTPQRGGRGSPAQAPAGRGRGAAAPRGGGGGGATGGASNKPPAGRKPASQFGTVYGSMPDLDDLMDEAEPAAVPVAAVEPSPQAAAPVAREEPPPEKSSLARPGPKATTAAQAKQFGTVYGAMPDLDDLMEEFGASPPVAEKPSAPKTAEHSPKKQGSPAFQVRHREVPQRQSKNFGTVYGSMPDIFDEEEEAAAAEQDIAEARKSTENPFLSQGPIFAGAPNRGRGRAAAQHRNQPRQQAAGGRGQAPGRGRGAPRGRPQQQQQQPPQQEQQQALDAAGERETVYGIMPF